MSKEGILRILERSRGQIVSGEQIAQELGVSRAAIWKAINVLKKEGAPIESVDKEGYLLREGADLLSLPAIAAQLRDPALAERIEILKSVDSTNSELKRRAQGGQEGPFVLISAAQTGGRGRMGRSFVSTEGAGLYMSVLLSPNCHISRMGLLTVLAALAVCRGLEELGARPSIKWPNDVIFEGRKLCGILTEAAVEGETGNLQYAIVGMGINIRPDEGMPDEVKEKAVSLLDMGVKTTRAQAAAKVLDAFFVCFEQCFAGGEAEILRQYQDRLERGDGYLNVVEGDGRSYEAKIVGLDHEAHLMVETREGERITLISQEISLRGIYKKE